MAISMQDAVIDIIRKFVDDNDIYCNETIYQTDRVIESGYDFISELCHLVGFKENN